MIEQVRQMKKLMHANHAGIHPSERLQAELEAVIARTRVGEKLLTEPLLAKQLGVSRSTLREAMRSFEIRGLIRRRQGQGTFVVGKRQTFEAGLEKLESIETIARRINLPVSMGKLTINAISADENLAGLLKITAGQPLMQIKRIILAENRPVAYLVDILLEGILEAKDLQQPEFNGSVLDILLTHSQPVLSRSYTEIQAIAAPAEIAHALQIQRGDSLLNLTGNLFSLEGQIIDHSESYFLPGYFRFHVVRTVGV